MSWNLAVLDIDAAEGIQEMFPEIGNWYISGYSLGGSMAAGYVAGHAEEYAGLIFLAAYSTEDISQSGLDVLSVYGNRDGVLDMEKYTSSLINLPENMEELFLMPSNPVKYPLSAIAKASKIVDLPAPLIPANTLHLKYSNDILYYEW